ncbi:MAG: response regulator [Candidatus Campbellbacteria bacterium]|nr:response regulator [Candidatus Campbellbacteria bacterium]
MIQTSHKVLMVDDDEFLMSLYQKRAAKEGLNLRIALNGKDALDILRGHDFVPDIVALDITMPGMSGMDVLKVIREENLVPNAEIAILSNTAGDAVMTEAKKLGVHKFIFKAAFPPSQIFDELFSITRDGTKG